MFSGPTVYPSERGSPVSAAAFQSEGPSPFYPPMCIKSHWDPTAILRKTLPTEYAPQALDPRPWTKICLEYMTTGEDMPAPPINPSTVMPTGGQFYPASRYMDAIDSESALRRMDRPLDKWCDKGQYEPDRKGDMYNPRLLVPDRINVNPAIIQEVAYPKALITERPYDCREGLDDLNIHLSPRLFNNATKQDRYQLKGKV